MFLRYNVNERRVYREQEFRLRTWQEEDYFTVSIRDNWSDVSSPVTVGRFQKSALGFGDKKRFDKLVNELLAEHFIRKYTSVKCKKSAVESQLLEALLCS